VDDLAVKPVVRVVIEGWPPLAVYRLADGIYCTDDTCTHEEAPLSDGEIEGECIVCPFHFGAFNIRTGKAERAPCSTGLRVHPVKVEGGDVYALLDAGSEPR
jgi:nitrite reductase/ring-hydroxylating ferredoxin subunit